MQRAGRVEKRQSIAGELLQDEAFPAEEPGPDATIQGDGHVDPARAAEKRVLLRDERPAPILEIDRLNLSRIWRRKRDVTPHVRLVGEEGNEERLARQHPFAGAEELAHQAAARARRIKSR